MLIFLWELHFFACISLLPELQKWIKEHLLAIKATESLKNTSVCDVVA